MTDTIFPDALEILRATNDGDDLDPQHLKLVEMAVNGLLNDKGRAAFADLLANVRAGYVKPWFHGLEHLTRDHQGFIYWKSHRVEHFEPAYARTPQAARDAEEIARRCIILEADGHTPSTSNVIWSWTEDTPPRPKDKSMDKKRMAGLEKLASRIKYYGDGYRWFNRRGHKCPNAIVAAFEDFEAEFGLVQETSDEDMNDLYARRPCE